ncbi:hypothetical protein FOZ63_026963 [Perkinsus olseni]|uniref:Uncharacterized protein n=1 Tax=Perkinsus olseni TaxID=32597 RepID=A0A7J6T144_PEROL|nr:hypothetical protein FOZ60_010305 [Perkinsus olseni]KAF4726840.1 hypothetical protein FOZ63_026963 [Perkinsus olseni]KAF4738823.1 hypothetical protein FOZ62_028575 [Perkinsus olseni]
MRGSMAAVLFSSLPLAIATKGASKAPSDDFPPRIPSFFDVARNATRCYFNNDKTSTEEYASLDIYVEADIVRTHAIYCPTTRKRHAFMASYAGSTALESYSPNYPAIDPTYEFVGGPLNDTGLDPLRKLQQDTFRRARDELYAAVKRKNFRPAVAYLFETFYDWETDAGQDVINRFVSLCSAVLREIKQKYKTYNRICGIYKRDFDKAVSAAHLEDRKSRTKKGVIRVTPA